MSRATSDSKLIEVEITRIAMIETAHVTFQTFSSLYHPAYQLEHIQEPNGHKKLHGDKQ
jgi:hypothetical protein